MDSGLDRQLRGQREVLLTCLLTLVGFLLVVVLRGGFVSVDAGVDSWAATIQTGSFTIVAVVISDVFDTNILLVVSLAAAALLFYKNYRKYSVLLLCAMGGDALLVSVIKAFVYSPRPANMLINETSNSFPSGHVTTSVVFFGLLTFFVWQLWNSSMTKMSSGVLVVAVTSVVGFDRIYLNVHWFSDVLGGCLLGIFWLTFVIAIFQRLEATGKFSSFLKRNAKNNPQRTSRAFM
jgi:membrane-associated phospholipid phosphatase